MGGNVPIQVSRAVQTLLSQMAREFEDAGQPGLTYSDVIEYLLAAHRVKE